MFLLNKKGRDPTVEGLIFLIGIMIVLYTLILPPCDKCRLLGRDCPVTCDEVESGSVLLLESPGDVGEVEDDNVRHVFDSANLFSKSGPESSILSNSLMIKNSLFGTLDQDLEFSLDDLENLKEFTLDFAVVEAKGNLMIYLNGKEIFNEHIAPNNVKSVRIPVEYLEEENTLTMSVNPPGFAFWTSNKYYLKDIMLIKGFELTHTSEVFDFSVGSSERSAIKDSELRFYVYCKGEMGQTNVLKAYLNENLLYSELLACINENFKVEIDEDYFESGTNQLEFSVSGGDFLVTDIEIFNEVEGKVYPSYTFYISDSIYEEDYDYYLFLDMYGDEKIADIIVNDDILSLDTDTSLKEYDLTNILKEGNNFIEIRPYTDFSIDTLKIGYV